MIISYRWLSDYLPVAVPVEKLSKILTSIGLEVENIEKEESVKGGLEGLIIGEVLTCIPHPNADKLKMTTVDTGSGAPLKIVCGASNVAAGQKVVVAPVGTTVYPASGESFKIKKAKIRGEESEGMLCAEDEIGLGESHAGILVLPGEAQTGRLAKDYFGLGESDYSIHIGLTPNRSDAASHLGVARDVCAWLSYHEDEDEDASVKMPAGAVLNSLSAPLPVTVDVDDGDDCPRYMGLCMDNVTIGASPEWLKNRLHTIGIRSINNAVDITNYVLHTYGQPLHAFDYDQISGHHILVKRLPADTVFTTLDGKERILTEADLMICDDAGGMCIAGVFGGAESGITGDTKCIFLESAVFNPALIRRSSLHHSLRTDAATHFEKGVDVNNLEPALLYAAHLLSELCGAKPASGLIDIYKKKTEQPTVKLSRNYLHKLSGRAYEPGKVSRLLQSLGFEIIEENDIEMLLRVPTYKHDINGPADVVEEILRIDGLDNVPIPSRLNISLITAAKDDRALREKTSSLLCGEGFSEIVTNSITNSDYYGDIQGIVRMKNSLSALLDCLRPRMLESGLEVVAYNTSRKQQDLLLFDFGNVYEETAPQQYKQSPRLALYATGNSLAKSWNSTAQAADPYFLKSVVENLADKSGIADAKWSVQHTGTVFIANGKSLATISIVTDDKLNRFDIRQLVYYTDIDWALWTAQAKKSAIDYKEVSRHPVVQRDLAIVVDKAVRYEQLEAATRSLKLIPLQSFELFDVFESEKLGRDKKSMALSYSFNLPDRTLTDAETDAMMQQIRMSYEDSLAAQIRG